MCRWASLWITRRRCCWWVKLKTTAPARPWRRTETPALRSSTWWVYLPALRVAFCKPINLTFVVSYCISESTCFCVVVCSQYECQYCQYHVKAQYKKMSSKRAELQSSFSGKAPNRVKGKGSSLRERLCQDGFYYGGMSSAACAASLWVKLSVAVSF